VVKKYSALSAKSSILMDSQVPSTFISTYPPIIVRGREGGDSKKEEIYTVREAEFKDLREVAELLVKSFYSNGGGGGFFGRTNVLKEVRICDGML